MNGITSLLKLVGPSRSSKIVSELQKQNVSEIAARQRISRSIGKETFRFPIMLLPNRESFIYLKEQRTTEQFWNNFLDALRETNAVYGYTIDSLMSKGGIVRTDEFVVISGAPKLMKGQVSSERVASTLIAAGAIRRIVYDNQDCFVIDRPELLMPDFSGFKGRQIVEDIVLDSLRDWARKLGLASYNSISTRRDDIMKRMVGPFAWDLTGPSYLMPLKGEESKPGFLVADVFSGTTMNEFDIKYIIRKAQLLRASNRHQRFLPILVADSFTGQALTKGRSEGILLATPDNLFGRTIAIGLKNLLETLKNAAAIAAANPGRLLTLIDQLKDIEGSASNLRGILFELIAAYIAKIQGGSIEFGITAKDHVTGKTADIDVLRIPHKGECIGIECKGKNPGGSVSVEEVENWLSRIPTFAAHLRSDPRFKDGKLKFELWTSGVFNSDALLLLETQQRARTKMPIDWKDGQSVFSITNRAKEKRINETLKEHFLQHPLKEDRY